MAKPYRLGESEIPARRTSSPYADIIADLIAQSSESMKVAIEGMKPTTLRAGLRRTLKGKEDEDVKTAQRGEETYLVRSGRAQG
jgi:hypothetical protein